MNLKKLLSKLSDIGVTVCEEKRYPDDGLMSITLSSDAVFPYPEGYKHWHTLTIPIEQDVISEEELEAVLRNLWEGAVDTSEW